MVEGSDLPISRAVGENSEGEKWEYGIDGGQRSKKEKEEMEGTGGDERKEVIYKIFQKSRKTSRSPEKKEGEERQEGLREMMREMIEETRKMWGRVEESLGER